LSIAREFVQRASADGSRIRLLQSEQGVSRARNAGLAHLSQASQWVVFCDADTRLAPLFLQHLNTWLNRHGGEGLSVGTTRVRPQPADRFYARGWFAAFDLIHRLTKSSFSIQIARTPIARGIGYREDLAFAEDLCFISECRRYGRFFFVPTDQVSTSTRRFESRGYLRQSLRWLFEALLPMRFKVHAKYDVIR
jgi:glycosyltransferase involved in cell wall biosynthesis